MVSNKNTNAASKAEDLLNAQLKLKRSTPIVLRKKSEKIHLNRGAVSSKKEEESTSSGLPPALIYFIFFVVVIGPLLQVVSSVFTGA